MRKFLQQIFSSLRFNEILPSSKTCFDYQAIKYSRLSKVEKEVINSPKVRGNCFRIESLRCRVQRYNESTAKSQ